MDPILVTGATGRVGRAVVTELRRAGLPVRALTRTPATRALAADVEVVAGDFTAPQSLDGALRGVSAVFLVWTAAGATAPAVIQRIAAHAPRLVFLSSPHRTPHPFFQQPNGMAVLHGNIERLIAEAGVASTIIRPGMFASNTLLWWAAAVRNGDVIRWPYAEVQTAPIDDRDIGAVAARALSDARHNGGDYVITGPAPVTHAEQVSTIGAVIGRALRYQELSPDEFRREMSGRFPAPAVEMLLAAWGAAMGRPAFVTSTVSEIVGSPARTFRQWAADHAAAFLGDAAGLQRT